MKETYPNIYNACLLIAVDNGGINRGRSVEEQEKAYNEFIQRLDFFEFLPLIDQWLGTLDNESLDTVCVGEYTEMMEIMKSAPPFTDDLLNTYFEEVC